jgi:hypothetical protein
MALLRECLRTVRLFHGETDCAFNDEGIAWAKDGFHDKVGDETTHTRPGYAGTDAHVDNRCEPAPRS